MVPLLSGIALFLVASVGTVVAGSIEMLVAARLLQGVGVAAGMVIGRAIVLDVCTGRPAARAMSLLMLIGGIAPVLAPVLGGLLVGSIGWRGLLAFVAAIGLGAAALTLLFVRESLPAEVRRQRRGTSRRGAWRALLTRGFAGNLAAYAFGMAIMMAYISASRSSTRR